MSSDEIIRERLWLAGELPTASFINPSARSRARKMCAMAGAWGVLSGFAIFLLSLEQEEAAGGWTFWAVLVGAACTVYLVESLRHAVEHGEWEFSFAKVFPTLFTVAVFEVFILGWHAVFELSRRHELMKKLHWLAGEFNWLEFCFIALLWILLGMVIAVVLGNEVTTPDRSIRAQVRRGVWVGSLTGSLASVGAILTFVVVLRICRTVGIFFADHSYFESRLTHLVHTSQSWAVAGLKVLQWGDALWDAAPWWGKGLIMGVLIVAAVAALFGKSDGARVAALLSLTTLTLGPLWAHLWMLCKLSFLSALVWAVPGVMLGMAVPYLRDPRRGPRFWPLSSLCAAAGLTAACCAGWLPKGFFFAVGLLLIGAWYLRKQNVRRTEYWPLLALISAALVCATAALLHNKNIHGVLAPLQAIDGVPFDDVPPNEFHELQNVARGADVKQQSKNLLARLLDRDAEKQSKDLRNLYAELEERRKKEETRPSGESGAAVGERQARMQAVIKGEERAVINQEKVLERFREGRVPQNLGLSILGSLAFWIAAGVLGTWRIVRQRSVLLEGGRCFWAKAALLEFHDKQHGQPVRTDRQCWSRLVALWGSQLVARCNPSLCNALCGLTPEETKSLDTKAEKLMIGGREIVLGGNKGWFGQVVATAERWVALYRDNENSGGRHLTVRWILQDPTPEDCERLVREVRNQIGGAAPIALWLQSAGLLPGAHFEGCSVETAAIGRSNVQA